MNVLLMLLKSSIVNALVIFAELICALRQQCAAYSVFDPTLR